MVHTLVLRAIGAAPAAEATFEKAMAARTGAAYTILFILISFMSYEGINPKCLGFLYHKGKWLIFC